MSTKSVDLLEVSSPLVENNSIVPSQVASGLVDYESEPSIGGIELDESLTSQESGKIFGLSIGVALGLFLTMIIGLVLLWWYWPSDEKPAKKKKVRFSEEVEQKEIPSRTEESNLAEIDLSQDLPPEKPEVISPYKTKPAVINRIMDGLFISDDYSARDYATVKSLGITQILSVGQELTPHINSGFITANIPIVDMESALIKKWFATALSFIKGGPTLVHCSQGISRSATICIAYLIMNGMSYDEALAKVKAARSMISPNEGFTEQLKELEKTKQPIEGFELKIIRT